MSQNRSIIHHNVKFVNGFEKTNLFYWVKKSRKLFSLRDKLVDFFGCAVFVQKIE